MKEKEIFIYVEGPSDKLGMEVLLFKIIEDAKESGVYIKFFPSGGKKPLLNKGPKKAANLIRNRPNCWVFLVPDLYPRNMGFPHESFSEMKNHLEVEFSKIIGDKDQRLCERFIVHCFKHDLEGLILAAEGPLLQRLGIGTFPKEIKWKMPIEDQDLDNPPKRIVERLFAESKKKYRDTVDVPWILEKIPYQEIETKCPQNFRPFIESILAIINN
jgi:hypothetical protein